MVALSVPAGQGLMYLGDSRTFGWNASPYSLGWANLLSAECTGPGASNVNNGAPGQYLQVVPNFNCYDLQYTPSKSQNNTAKVFFGFGTNDVKGDATLFTVVDFKARLLVVVDALVSTKGFAYGDIILSSINYFSAYETNGAVNGRARHLAYNAAIKEVAQLRKTIFQDPFTYFDGLANKDALIDTDGIHENTAGHRALADFYKAADYTPSVSGFRLARRLTSSTPQ